MPFGPLVVFAYVDQQKSFPCVHAALDVRDVRLLHALFCVLHKLQKLRRMRHWRLPCPKIFRKSVAQRPAAQRLRAGYGFGVAAADFCSPPFAARARTRFTKFHRTFSGTRSPSSIIFPLPLVMM